MARTIPLLALLLLAIGCVDTDGPSVFVAGNAALEDDCTVEADDPLLKFAPGTFNAQFGTSYTIFPWLQSQLVDRSNTGLSADPNWVILTGAEVELREPGGAVIAFGGLPNPFTVETSVTIPSTENPNEPGRSVGALEVIPPAYAQAFDAMLGDAPDAVMGVVASVLFFGETTGGVDVDVAPYTWPVTVCQGNCLLRCGTVPTSCTPCSDGGECIAFCGNACTAMTAAIDCSPDDLCINSTCFADCVSDADCDSGEQCLLGGRCVVPLRL
jgi:hypothetical protein